MGLGATTTATGLECARGSAVRLPRSQATRLVALHVVAPLVVGAAIYVFWRTPEPMFVSWLREHGVSATIASLREAAAPATAWLPAWMLLYLPDAAWVYSLTAAVALLWSNESSRSRRGWLIGALVFALAYEFGQLIHVTPGLFDPWDLVVTAAAWLAAMLTLARRTRS
jgi:hypothetical protein